ncbi:VWA domain-containing protein [bacterium]|nr:VWA domain-containing protein [bacterium]
MNRTANFSALGTSIVVHGLLLGSLAVWTFKLQEDQPDVVLESVFDDERVQEEFTQDLETDQEIAETQNFVAGGAVSTAIGGSGAPAVAQQKVEQSESLQEVDFNVNVSNIDLPGENLIGQDLGVGEVNGEVGAVVEGYGAALGRITQELIRLMRKEKIMAIWLFDESNSMKDDQQEIAQKFHKVYEELGIQQKTDKVLKDQDQVLLTQICSFGKGLNFLTSKPTTDINEIRQAIDRISIDESGDENMCSAIEAVINKYKSMARGQRRRMVVIIVSDESPSDSGDLNFDSQALENAIKQCEDTRTPAYVLGREAIFGYPFARIHWKDPVYQLTHWVQINRGPETGFPECLQWNGLHSRWDSFSSGFGPYSQVRLCKETGGVFFMLPGEEENLAGAGANEARKFAALAMKEYEPLLLARRDYAEARARSKFRSGLWDIIVETNPHLNNELNMRVHHYSTTPEDFAKEAGPQFKRAVDAMALIEKSLKSLDQIRPLRAKEDSQRWRACFDLMYAQLISYRIRLFQYLLLLDDHQAKQPKPKDPKHNEWNLGYTKKMVEPDEEQFKRLKAAFKLKIDRSEYLKMLVEQAQMADEAYELVKKEHPGTPWERRAKYEENDLGYGMYMASGYRDPKYQEVGKRIKIPKF